MSTSLAKLSEIPAHLQKYIKAGDERHNDLGPLSASDFGVAFLKICTGTSKECRKGPAGEPAIPVGAMFVSRDRTIIPVGARFIPLCRSVSYIKWIGKPGEGKMEFQTRDQNDPRIKACNGLDFGKDTRTGESVPPLVSTYINFYIMVQGVDEPILLSFYRSSTPLGKKLTQELFRLTDGNKYPLFSTVFALQQPIEQKKGQNIWSQFNPVFFGYTPEAALPQVEALHEFALTLRDASKGAEFSQIEGSESESEEKTQKTIDVAPANVTVSSPIAPATPPPTQQAAQTPPPDAVALF